MARQRLIENFRVTPQEINFSLLTESTKKTLYEGREYECLAVFTVPISRPGKKNFNERIYTVKLWENVIKNQKEIWDGSFGLMNHPEDEGNPKDGFCVWHNLRFNEDKTLVIADMYLFGEWGKHAVDAMRAGGRIGLSSSGFGDMEEDGITVKSDFTIERVADWVLNPSYQVFGSIDDEIDQPKTVKEKAITNKLLDESVQENTMKDKISEAEARSLRLNIKNLMKEASLTENLEEKITQYDEILSFIENVEGFSDIVEKATAARTEAKTELIALAEKGKQLDTVKAESDKTSSELNEKVSTVMRELNEIKSKYEIATKMLDEQKQYVLTLKEMYENVIAEKNGMVTAKDYKEAVSYSESLEKEIAELKNKISLLRKNPKQEGDSMRRVKKSTLKTRKNEDIYVDDYEDEFVEDEFVDDDLYLDDDMMEEPVFESKKKKIEKKKKKEADPEDDDDEELEEEEDEEEDEEEEDKKESSKKSKTTKKKKEADPEDDEEELEEEEDDSEEDDSEEDDEKEESMFSNRADIREYYQDLVESNPNVAKIKSQILKCKTLFEAQKTYLNLKDLVESVTSTKNERTISESVKGTYDSSSIKSLIRKGWR